MKLLEISMNDRTLNRPLGAYPNIAFVDYQRVDLPVGTPVRILTDYAKQNIIKFEAEGKVWFSDDNEFFTATRPVSKR